MSENILEIKDLTKDYGDFVLDKVSFALPRGVIMGLIGENGAGNDGSVRRHSPPSFVPTQRGAPGADTGNAGAVRASEAVGPPISSFQCP